MANWTFSNQYKDSYPDVTRTILGQLVFSEHTLQGNTFEGTVDIVATGAILSTLNGLLALGSFILKGTITTTADSLSAVLLTDQTTGKGITKNFATAIPLLDKVLKAAWIDLETEVAKKSGSPYKETFVLDAAIQIGTHTVMLASDIPVNNGFMTISVQPQDLGVTLSDLNFLFGDSESGWQSSYPKQYDSGTGLFLMEVSLSLYIGLSPRTVMVYSVSVRFGLKGFPVIAGRLYLNPLAVIITLLNPSGVSGTKSLDVSIQGDLALVNYSTPGNYQNPDFDFDFGMDITHFSIYGGLRNPKKNDIGLMISDLTGEKLNADYLSGLTIKEFDFAASTDPATGSIDSYSFAIDVEGEFGRLKYFEIEEIRLALSHSPA